MVKKGFVIVLYIDCLFEDRGECWKPEDQKCAICVKECIEKEFPCFEVTEIEEIKSSSS